jgi:regulator of protease activity HflC (stomatin/prohibitin superfamily)
MLAAAAALSLGACTQIDDNEIGLRRVYGEMQEQPVKGMQWYNPWSTDIITFDNQQTAIESDLTTPTHDQQRAHVTAKATVQLDRNSAARMYRNVGADWANKIVPQILRSVQIAAIGRQTALGMIQNQSEVEQDIRTALTNRLRTRGIILSDFQVTGVKFSDQYMNAVEQKATAVQQAEGEKNRTVAIRERGEQTKIRAEAEAQAMRVRAQALESNPKLVQYEAVQKWDGHLPQYMLGNSTPFINLDKAQ